MVDTFRPSQNFKNLMWLQDVSIEDNSVMYILCSFANGTSQLLGAPSKFGSFCAGTGHFIPLFFSATTATNMSEVAVLVEFPFTATTSQVAMSIALNATVAYVGGIFQVRADDCTRFLHDSVIDKKTPSSLWKMD